MKYKIHTENSTYIYDVTKQTITRYTEGRALRRDDEPVAVLAAKEIRLFHPMELILDIREDGIQTRRTTSPVVGASLYQES